MMEFVDLQRRFHELTDSELEDIEALLAWSGSGYGPDIGWSELLEYARVILLAEAGSGKSEEMREQARRLAGDGRFAFFIPLESLDQDPVTEVLSIGEEERFVRWKADVRESAWFFLDAVDELKLTEGKLDRALNRLSKAIDGHLHRARVIISCRPSDWRSGSDLNTVRHRLPVPKVRRDSPVQPPEEVFIDALRHEHSGQSHVTPEEQEDPNQETVRTVAMLPMSDGQIRAFAEWRGMNDPAVFLAEIARQDAWNFARRPLDLNNLIEAWLSSERLGTRAEQHEANVAAKLKDDPQRPDRGVLADTKARLGAERLALALALTRTRTIRWPEQTLDRHRTDGVLDAATILPDWTPAERQALLRRALFDPATYGRVRFHHRSVQEYLAAQRLRGLHEKGMSIKVLFRLLFAERYGVAVAFPSLRAVAAWLALWVDAVRKELIGREPEVLMSLGDPGSLGLPTRGSLLRAFVSKYGQGSWRGLDIPFTEMRRLAHPGLATVIRECWGDGSANEEVRDLLINLIRLGPVEASADLACGVALDTAASEYHRIVAIKALLACGWNESVRDLADAMLTEPTSWPDRIVHGIASSLFPEIITADELVALMERTREPQNTVGGFDWASRQIAESIEAGSNSANAVRDKMTDLVWRGRTQTENSSHIHSVFGHLTPALAMLSNRQLSATTGRPQAPLIRASVIASRFGGRRVGGRELVRKLRAHFNEEVARREDAFWAELAFMDEVCPSDDARQRLRRAEREGLAGYLNEADRPWLEATLADEHRPERHAVALHAWIDGWYQRGRVAAELDAIRANLKKDALLVRILEQRTAPPEPDEEFERMERDHERWKRDQARSEARHLEIWRKWREELLADPDDAFSAEKQRATRSSLYSWLSSHEQARNRRNRWDKDALVQAFGQDIADQAEEAFRAIWRDTPPVLWSALPIDERGRFPPDCAHGLTGVSAEAATPGWTASLSPCEVRTAVAYATIEIHGFAPFIIDLVKSHPREVEEVIGGEVSAELRVGGDHGHLPALENVAYSDNTLKRLLIPRLIAELNSWPTDFTVDTESPWERRLDSVVRVLSEADDSADRETIARECADRYVANPLGALALAWLRGLFQFDAVEGAQVMIRSLGDRKAAGSADRAIEIFAALFGDRGAVALEVEDPSQCARLLGQLVRYAYAFVQPEHDQVHEGVYTPNARDKAATARHFLLSKLLDTPGPDARRILLELADEDAFAHIADRLRFQARQRAAMDAEFLPFTPADVIDLDRRHEAPPRDPDGLFTLMMDRLGDFAHDLAHDDFTIRSTLGRIATEREMQRNLAWHFRQRAKGIYKVTREEEVADNKQPDIRLSVTNRDLKAAGQPHIKLLFHQYLTAIVIIEPSPNALLPDTDFRILALEKIHRHMPNHSEIMGRIASTNPALIFTKRHVQSPMQSILDPPMRTHRLVKQLHVIKRGDVVALFPAHLPFAMTFRLHHPNRFQSGPSLADRQMTQVGGQEIASVLHPTMTLVRRFFILNLRPFEILPLRRLEISPELSRQLLLVVLHGQDVIPTSFVDLLRDLSLATHCVHGHDAPLQFQLLQQFRDRRNLVRLLLRLHLSEDHTIAARPCADHMQRLHSILAVMRPSVCLAIHCHNLAFTERDHIFDPTPEAFLKTTDRKRRDNARNRVVDRHPVGQRHIPAKPFQLRASEFLDVTPAVGATDHGTHAQDDDIDQLMLLVSINSWVFQLGEMFDETLRRCHVLLQSGRKHHLIISLIIVNRCLSPLASEKERRHFVAL